MARKNILNISVEECEAMSFDEQIFVLFQQKDKILYQKYEEEAKAVTRVTSPLNDLTPNTLTKYL